MGRRELREHIFRLLFRRDFFPEEEMKEQEALYIEYLADPEQEEVDYIVRKTEKIMAMIPELDSMVNEHAVGWQTDRMGKVDLTIIRLAVYEMKFDEDIPVSVAINEAVELAKRYGTENSPAFINGVLAKIFKPMNRKQVYSVSSVNQYIKSLFMDDFALNHIYVRGEVSNCKYHSSGHIYFTLKDRGGAIACVMFAGNRKGLNFRMTEGMAVIVFGSVSVYERDGRYQLYAREIMQEGAGKLYEAYEALKKKLLAEGLFDEEHKLDIPKYPKRLGVVTARTGAAVQDIINVSLRRNPWLQIVFCPATVQGEGAVQSVVRGIRALEEAGVDVMYTDRRPSNSCR